MALHTTRTDSTILNAAIYNPDHVAHNTNLVAAANTSRVRGLVADTSTTTTITLQASAIVLQSAGTHLPIRLNQPAPVTCNISSTGPIANGRDQAAVFGSAAWVSLYFIWNGSTLASLASLNATTPTLPSGFTHWCYAMTLRTLTAGVLTVVHARGHQVFYELDDPPAQRVVSSGAVTTFSNISFTNWVPPETLYAVLTWLLVITHATATGVAVFYRAIESPSAGEQVLTTTVAAAGQGASGANTRPCYLTPSRTGEYRLSLTPTSGGLYLDVAGYALTH